MATTVMLKHPQTGVVKTGLFGFSWTTFFFGGFPAIFRGDILTGVLVLIGSMLSCGIVGLIWAFIYNKRYTVGLIEQGYEFCDREDIVMRARAKLGIADVPTAPAAQQPAQAPALPGNEPPAQP